MTGDDDRFDIDDGFDIEVADANELSNKSRIRDLLQRRKEVLDARNNARAEMRVNGSNTIAALEVYYTYLTGLIMDLWTKLTETQAGQKLLHKVEIYKFTIQPPQDELERMKMAHGINDPAPKNVAIDGLNWFVERNSVIVEASFTMQTWNPPGETELTQERPIPWAALDRALIACQEYMNEIGVDADLHLDNYDGGEEPGI